jgi:hypothetical protein
MNLYVEFTDENPKSCYSIIHLDINFDLLLYLPFTSIRLIRKNAPV